jgi:tetratricopeptide (TPR) repeat protein
VYEYMMTLAGNPDKREDVFPLLVRSYLRQEEYTRSATYAEKYMQEYPEGAHEKSMYFLWVKSLRKADQPRRAAELLRAPDRPVSRDLDSLAGRLFFSMGRFGEAERYLARATGTRWRKAPPKLLLLRGECLYRTGVFSQALPIYSFLEHEGYQADQARYRMGQIRMKTGRVEGGAKLWQRIVDNKESPLWSDLAEEGLAIRALKKEND